jgi:hypothetical protein
VKTLMLRMGIEALYRRPRTTKPEPGHKIYPYLLRGMEVMRPNQVWAMDITYIPMAKGFVYLAVDAAPVGFVKAGDRLEKDPDRRVQEAIALVFDKVAELGSARQASPRRGRCAMSLEKIGPHHLERKAILYVRQSSPYQVLHNRESSALQYAMRDRLSALGWSRIETVDDDLGRSAAGGVIRAGFERMVAEVCLGKADGADYASDPRSRAGSPHPP